MSDSAHVQGMWADNDNNGGTDCHVKVLVPGNTINRL